MRKHLILVLLSLLWASSALTTTYDVDNCVTAESDSNNGTSTSTPWLTIAHVNAQSFNPGDSVLFQSTCIWREQLTPPSSGSSGNPITFGSYGTGALPTINGATLVTSWNSGTVTNVSGFVTHANMKMSITGGTAFVDFSAANRLTSYLGGMLTITDSSGKQLTGYIKAAGSGETYRSELLGNTAFNTTTGVGAWNNITLYIRA